MNNSDKNPGDLISVLQGGGPTYVKDHGFGWSEFDAPLNSSGDKIEREMRKCRLMMPGPPMYSWIDLAENTSLSTLSLSPSYVYRFIRLWQCPWDF